MDTLINFVTEHYFQVIIGGTWSVLMLLMPVLLIRNRNIAVLSDLKPATLGLLAGFVKTAEIKYNSRVYIKQCAINVLLIVVVLGFGMVFIGAVMAINLVILQPIYKMLLKVYRKTPLVLAFSQV